MKPNTRLSSAVFQLTPTRTRCELIVIANDKKEKLASGLINPFLAHLKTAQDQFSKGGYSILLEPEGSRDASWFTKVTVERFVRFVSTPEILERVQTVEAEILQIEEAISIQCSNDIGHSSHDFSHNTVENHHEKPLGGHAGKKSKPSVDENAIVVYMPRAPSPEVHGSCPQEGNSKLQLLKVLETRKNVLQKEQGMAFARAVAAGFHVDDMTALVSFAECFGALRLIEACSRYVDLWKCKHETGQWLDIAASEAFLNRSDFSMMAAGVIFSDTVMKPDESNHLLPSENNERPGPENDAGGNQVPNGQLEYTQAHFPYLAFPPWPVHGSPGGPVFQAYPVQGVPYYQHYSGGHFFQPNNQPMEPSPSNFIPHQSLDTGEEMGEINETRYTGDIESDARVSRSLTPHKKVGGSKKKKHRTVVIGNINYISKEKNSESESNSDSPSESDGKNEYFEFGSHEMIHQNNKRTSGSGESNLKSLDKLIFNDEVSIPRKDADDRHWQAFQDCLLRRSNEDALAGKEGTIAMEKDVKIKKQTGTASDDMLTLVVRKSGDIKACRMRDISGVSRIMRPFGSGKELLIPSAGNDLNESNNEADIQFTEANRQKLLLRTTHEDFMISSQQNQDDLQSSSDKRAVNCFDSPIIKKDRGYLNGIPDESLLVPFRSMLLDQVDKIDRAALDIDSEIPLKNQNSEFERQGDKVNYESNDLSLMPERQVDRRSIVYDLVLDCEMQVCAERSVEKLENDVSDVKGGFKKSEKERKSKVTSDSLQKPRTGDPTRNGKSLKMSPPEDARARAERLRSYKADMQKIKKEKEEAEKRRIESLKLERQKRITVRGGSASMKPSSVSPQIKQLPAKLSPATSRGSKFNDFGPGSSSPLQRSKIRASLGYNESIKSSKASKLSSRSNMAGNRLTRSSSSLSESKKGIDGVTADSEVSFSRIRRLLEPRTVAHPPLAVKKARSAEAASRRRLPEGPDRSKVSAIINLDRSKAESLPVLKIRSSKSHADTSENSLAIHEVHKVNGMLSYASVEANANNCNMAHEVDADDNNIAEKAVVALEYENPSFQTLHVSEGKPKVQNQQNNPLTPIGGIGREFNACQQVNKSNHLQVTAGNLQKDIHNIPDLDTPLKPHQATDVHTSSLGHACTHHSEYCKAPIANSEMPPIVDESVRALPHAKETLKTDHIKSIAEKTSIKEPSKGLRHLLKFGKKNHTSSSVDQSVDPECSTAETTEHNIIASKIVSTSEVLTLKNIISEDETSTAGSAPQKTSRHFSLLSPFRGKITEKKQQVP